MWLGATTLGSTDVKALKNCAWNCVCCCPEDSTRDSHPNAFPRLPHTPLRSLLWPPVPAPSQSNSRVLFYPPLSSPSHRPTLRLHGSDRFLNEGHLSIFPALLECKLHGHRLLLAPCSITGTQKNECLSLVIGASPLRKGSLVEN